METNAVREGSESVGEEGEDAGRRQLLRGAVSVVREQGASLVSAARASSSVVDYAVEQVSRNVVGPIQRSRYVQPLDGALTSADHWISSRISDEIDDALQMWQRLKQGLRNSAWYRNVEQVLSGRMISSDDMQESQPTSRAARAAELFFDASVACYMKSRNTLEEFSETLRIRLGSAWDERLAPSAESFFATAQAAVEVIGATRFLRAARNLAQTPLISNTLDRIVDGFQQLGLGKASTEEESDDTSGVDEPTAELLLLPSVDRTDTGSEDDESDKSDEEEDEDDEDEDEVYVGHKRRRSVLLETDGESSEPEQEAGRRRLLFPDDAVLRDLLSQCGWFERLESFIRETNGVGIQGDVPTEMVYRMMVSTVEKSTSDGSCEQFMNDMQEVFFQSWSSQLQDLCLTFWQNAERSTKRVNPRKLNDPQPINDSSDDRHRTLAAPV